MPHLELVALIVRDYQPAIDFFVNVLQFELVENVPSLTNDGRPKRWVVVRPVGSGTGILLARADGERQLAVVGEQFAGRVGFFLRVDDFATAHARMIAAGVKFITAPRVEPYGQVAVFLDIEGNLGTCSVRRPAPDRRLHQSAESSAWPREPHAMTMKTLVCLTLVASPLAAQLRPVNTYSIVARDSTTGQIGVAVQSHWFAVGQIVPWAEAGVGAVATQSFVDPSYGKLGLDLLRAGKSAPEALRALLHGDGACHVRQVGMIDTKGDVATFTGSRDIVAAGGIAGHQSASTRVQCGSSGGVLLVGRDFAVQANLMANDAVWPAMAKAFAASNGDLADRMLAALDAAQAAGGDIRGRQSAALVVVSATGTGKPWQDRVFDVRVDDHESPLVELRRLVAVHRAYNHMNAGDLAVEHNDAASALREYAAAEQIAATTPGIPRSRHAEMLYWHAVALVNMKRVEESLPLFARAFELQPSWRELTTRLPRSGLLPDDSVLIKRIITSRPHP